MHGMGECGFRACHQQALGQMKPFLSSSLAGLYSLLNIIVIWIVKGDYVFSFVLKLSILKALTGVKKNKTLYTQFSVVHLEI